MHVMADTLRNDNRRWIFLERLTKASDKRPDMTFGQLFGKAFEGRWHLVEMMDDREIIERIEEVAMMEPTKQ